VVLVILGLALGAGIVATVIRDRPVSRSTVNSRTDVSIESNAEAENGSAESSVQTIINGDVVIDSQVTAGTAVNPETDWNLYENKRDGYSIRYPKDWTVSEVLAPLTVEFIPPTTAPTDELSLSLFIHHDERAVSVDLIRDRTSMTINGVATTRQIESGLIDLHAVYVPNGGRYIKLSWPFDVSGDTYEQLVKSFRFRT